MQSASFLHWVMDSRFPLSDFRYFNSPFEVLFNFPSRYLFTIDLSPLSSHGWRLPPLLRSTPKERDSRRKGCTPVIRDKNRAVTFFGVPFQASYSRSLNSPISDAQLHQRWINISDFSHFVRHYYGNPSWFLFLRLIICLNSAGSLV